MGSFFSSAATKTQPSQPIPRQSQSQPQSPSPSDSTPVKSQSIQSPPITPTSPTTLDFSSQSDAQWEQRNLSRIVDTFSNAGKFLQTIGELQTTKDRQDIRKGFANYAQLNASDRKNIENFRTELEQFHRDLDNTLEVLSKYSDENKRESQLTLEVKVDMKLCYEWIDMFQQNKVPENFLVELGRKSRDLSTAIQLETLAQQLRLNQQAEMLKRIQMIDKKKPWEYYEDGKYLWGQKRLLEAKASFLCYRNYVLDEKVIIGDERIKEPSKDNHLHYLAQIQDQINQSNKELPENSILSVAPVKNQYWYLWEQWKDKHMNKT